MTVVDRSPDAALTVPAVAGPEDVAPGLDERLGRPGEPPFTRGIYADMYRGRRWAVRQLAGFGTPADTNARYRFLLAKGATAINGVFDYPSLRAFDSDDERAMPDVGRGGVAVDTVDDFADLFEGIALEEVSVSLVSSQPVGAVPHLAMFLAAASRRGVAWDRLRGTSQNDFLMETCVTIGPDALPPHASFQLECDLAEFCLRSAPRWNGVSVAAYNYREAGADAVLEVALALAHGCAVVEELVRRGVAPDRAARQVTFFFAAHLDLFEEVAKFRAARRLWHRLATGRLGCQDPASGRLRFHAQTSGTTFRARSPLTNIGRGAIEGLAAVLGGAQSLHINGFDEAYAIPTELSASLALQTQHILLDEVGVTRSADPLGGSYLVEHLTDTIEDRVSDLLRSIDNDGGIVALTESGWVHDALARTAYRDFVATSGPDTSSDDEDATDAFACEPFVLPDGVVDRQARRLHETRARRPETAVRAALAAVRAAAAEGRNAVPAVVEAVGTGATLGEAGTAFRQAFGTWTIPIR